eukprot:8789883-Alexandrium_andersonii.AAC.1
MTHAFVANEAHGASSQTCFSAGGQLPHDVFELVAPYPGRVEVATVPDCVPQVVVLRSHIVHEVSTSNRCT